MLRKAYLGARRLAAASPSELPLDHAARVFLTLGALAAALLLSLPARSQEPLDPSYRQRRERLENMSAAEKEKLFQQKERFDQLPAEERERLREMHARLVESPEGEELFGVLQRYCQWLTTLTPSERSELLALPPEQRIERIGELMKKQEEQRLRNLANLSYEEGKAVLEWLDELVQAHEQELWDLLPQESQEFIRKRADDAEKKRRMMVWSLLFRWNQGEKLREITAPNEDDVQRLLERLSEERREDFRKLRDADRQRELIQRWIGAAVAGRTHQRVSDAELQEFFVNELPREKQAELEMMPREQRVQELQKLFFAHKFGSSHWGRGRGDRSRPGRDGRFHTGPRGPDHRDDEPEPPAK